MSNFAKGMPPRGLENHDPVVHRSISAYARLEDAIKTQRLFPQLGSHVALFELADADPELSIARGPTHAQDSHHSLQGDPEAFLGRIRDVFPCQGG